MNTLSSQRPSATATRLTRLRNEIDRNGWSALLVTDLVDVRWITGFSSSNAAAIVTSSDAFVVTDFRYQQAASSLGAGIEPRVINQNLFGELGTLLGEIVGTGAVAYSPASLTHRSFLQLTEGLPDALTPASGWATAFPALSCQTAKWFTSTPPMLTTIRSTSRLVTLRLSVVYRLEPPCSIIAK